MTIDTPPPPRLADLAEWDTPALSNALDALRIRPFDVGHTDGSVVRITGSIPMVGRAVTAKMVARRPGDDAVPVSELHRLVAGVEGPVVVVLEDVDAVPGGGAFLGEVNGSLLDALGIAGFLTNGRVRDVAELRQMSYPVFGRGLCVSRSYMRLVEVGCDVSVGGMSVSLGDVVHGDEHGVLSIPSAALPGIVDKAELIRADEQQVVGWSRSDEFSIDGLLALKRVRH